MIPTQEQITSLWDTYHFPEPKRTHVLLVCDLALFLAGKISQTTNVSINRELLRASALLHDIDKAVPRETSEHHPDTGVRLLRGEGMGEIADVIKTHSLSAILDPTISPKSWEEKLLYLADKMVKYELVGVDGRFALWRAEKLPPQAYVELDATYPKVKALEQEIGSMVGIDLTDVAHLAQQIKTSTMSNTGKGQQ